MVEGEKNQSFLSRERTKLIVQNGVSFEGQKAEECGGFLMQLGLMLEKMKKYLAKKYPFPTIPYSTFQYLMGAENWRGTFHKDMDDSARGNGFNLEVQVEIGY